MYGSFKKIERRDTILLSGGSYILIMVEMSHGHIYLLIIDENKKYTRY